MSLVSPVTITRYGRRYYTCAGMIAGSLTVSLVGCEVALSCLANQTG